MGRAQYQLFRLKLNYLVGRDPYSTPNALNTASTGSE